MSTAELPPLYAVRRGEGPDLILVHGSATDADGWVTQLATLTPTHRVLAYDRRGTPRSPLPDGLSAWSVAQHAEELRNLVEPGTRPLVVGSSFGAVCALEAARRTPNLFRGLVLIEPPLPESEEAAPMPESFMGAFDAIEAQHGGPEAATFFLRMVLGEAAFEAMPRRWRERSITTHAAIRLDCEALLTYPLDYGALGAVDVPVLLLGGGRSAPHFRATLRALERALPRAQLQILPSAGHMMHAEAARSFARLVVDFDGSLAPSEPTG